MGLFPNRIQTALEKFGARTLQEYREKHLRAIKHGRAALPALDWRDPWDSPDTPDVLVDSGAWKVVCTTDGCSNRPVLDVTTSVALCFECGAIYSGLGLPAESDGIALRLLMRPLSRRQWAPGESLEQLDRENAELGVS